MRYLAGFGNAFESEAIEGALPRGQNTPHEMPHGLYPEALNGTPFTSPRAENLRTWLYKIRPSVLHREYRRVSDTAFGTDFSGCDAVPTLMRWKAQPLPDSGSAIDFVDGLATIGGSHAAGANFAVHAYSANASMTDRAFYDSDGDLLIVPQTGALRVQTELGWLEAAPGEVLLVPRGIKLSVHLSAPARGFVLETLDSPLRLPERGLLGSNGLAEERHFLAPVAAYEEREVKGYRVTTKLDGKVWEATQDHSPYDAVAWHGRHVPFKYDLANFNTYGTVTFDHPDPSILTVLGCPACDFAVFSGRWDVAEHTFRPPFFHRNAATELNVVLRDPSPPEGFEPGGATLTPMMTGHGITPGAFAEEVARKDAAPRRTSDDSLWVQFESRLTLRITKWALEAAHRDVDYYRVFEGYASRFEP